MPKYYVVALLALTPVLLSAQGRDSVQRLPEIGVTITRIPAPISSLGAAVTVIDSAALHRNRLTPNLDEALATVPGVVIGNRWNYSLDQRLSIRGFGARANFGWRGVKVLIDGIPQTLPDGQSQLSHLDLSLVNRIEVLRGAASAQYGNASGGVISFTTIRPSERPSLTLRAESGSLGFAKYELVAAGTSGDFSGTLSGSYFETDGLRQHSAAEQHRLNGNIEWQANAASRVTLRLSMTDDPTADNPGALTLSELTANRDSAAASNLRRVAGKAIKQTQVALGYHHQGEAIEYDLNAWTLRRDLDNPLAAPAPAPATPTEGTWVGIDRSAVGFRGSATWRHGRQVTTFGADMQQMRDDRTNERSAAGKPTGVMLLDQRETVRELGPFITSSYAMTSRTTLTAGARYDAISFKVDDHLQLTGDGSGKRDMSAASGNVGISWRASDRITTWANVATSFETPTTTELANQPSGATGINNVLEPQRSISAEVGVRGEVGNVNWDAATWYTSTSKAIIPALDNGGRTFYQNAGHTHTNGVEATVSWSPWTRLQLSGTGTTIKARFGDYFSVADSLQLRDKQLAGLPKTSARLGLLAHLGRGFSLDVDQTFRSAMFADDKNSIAVEGLSGGITGARLGWHGDLPFGTTSLSAAVLNAFDKDYIGAVTINGAGGRVFEPAAGRTVVVGVEVRW